MIEVEREQCVGPWFLCSFGSLRRSVLDCRCWTMFG